MFEMSIQARRHVFSLCVVIFFFFNDTATTEIYTLSLHDALPICGRLGFRRHLHGYPVRLPGVLARSEEHTSELQSHEHLVCRLLLEKKKKYVLYNLCVMPFWKNLTLQAVVCGA